MMNQTVAILGSHGMLGTAVASSLVECNYPVYPYRRPAWDITDSTDLESAVRSAQVIINCAAYTNVDGAESDYESAREVNALAVQELGRLAARDDKFVVHVSTDFVFDGTKDGSYTEDDIANPINLYGKSKYEGEILLQETGCRACILRVEWTYGPAGTNFVTKIRERAAATEEVRVVSDQFGSPTSTKEAAAAVSEIVENQIEGLYLFAAQGYASRYDVAKFIVERLGYATTVTPCKTSDFPAPATRPLNSRFDCAKIDRILKQPRGNWEDAMGEHLGLTIDD